METLILLGILGPSELIIGIIFVLIPIYFLPTILGHKKKDSLWIILINIFFGWTLVGWLGSLVWAIVAEKEVIGYNHRCIKCGYAHIITQKVNMYRCPNCQTDQNLI